MFYISWGPEFEIGIAEIDSHHKHLIGIFNDLVAATEMGGGPVVVEDTLNKLVDYTKFHFKREEELMAAYGCPADKTEAHKKEHAALIEDLDCLVNNLPRHPSFSFSNTTLKFLGEWLTRHTQGTDRDCGVLLRRAGLV